MINFNDVTMEIRKEQSLNLFQIPDHLRKILIICGSGSGKTNPLLKIINHQPDIDNKYLYVKYPYETKILITK